MWPRPHQDLRPQAWEDLHGRVALFLQELKFCNAGCWNCGGEVGDQSPLAVWIPTPKLVGLGLHGGQARSMQQRLCSPCCSQELLTAPLFTPLVTMAGRGAKGVSLLYKPTPAPTKTQAYKLGRGSCTAEALFNPLPITVLGVLKSQARQPWAAGPGCCFQEAQASPPPPPPQSLLTGVLGVLGWEEGQFLQPRGSRMGAAPT